MRSWPCVSVALIILVFSASAPTRGATRESSNAEQAGARRANETLLAGLRPGRDTFAVAEKRFKAKNLAADDDTGIKEWRDACSGRAIRLELDGKSVIQSITITSLADQEGKCDERLAEFLNPRNWATGLGLRIGASQDQIVGLYGEPNSSGPATKNGRDLALFYYQFDWAGSSVPQVMEVLCARDSGRVVEITLAYPSL